MKYDIKYPDPSEPPGPWDSTSIQHALGEALISFELLDAQLSTAISFLLGPDGKIGRIVTAELPFKGKVNLVGSLFRHTAPQSKNLEHLAELLGACFKAEEKRNQIVHSKWENVLDGSAMKRTKYTARHKNGLQQKAETLTPAQVQAIAVHCEYLAFSLDEVMFWEFGERYGEP